MREGLKREDFFLLRKISNGVTEKRGRAKTGHVTHWRHSLSGLVM